MCCWRDWLCPESPTQRTETLRTTTGRYNRNDSRKSQDSKWPKSRPVIPWRFCRWEAWSFTGCTIRWGADSIIISGIADRVAARTRGLLFPVIKFTQCPAYTAHFQGTISIRPEVMTMYYADVLRNLLRMGFRKILILNGHDGNIGPGRGAIGQVADEVKDSAMLFENWWEFLPEDMMKTLRMFHQANGGHGHGGFLETSAVAAFRPDLIHLDKARDLPEPPDLSGGPPYFLQKSTASDWPGYSGHVSEASEEKGKKLV